MNFYSCLKMCDRYFVKEYFGYFAWALDRARGIIKQEFGLMDIRVCIIFVCFAGCNGGWWAITDGWWVWWWGWTTDNKAREYPVWCRKFAGARQPWWFPCRLTDDGAQFVECGPRWTPGEYTVQSGFGKEESCRFAVTDNNTVHSLSQHQLKKNFYI